MSGSGGSRTRVQQSYLVEMNYARLSDPFTDSVAVVVLPGNNSGRRLHHLVFSSRNVLRMRILFRGSSGPSSTTRRRGAEQQRTSYRSRLCWSALSEGKPHQPLARISFCSSPLSIPLRTQEPRLRQRSGRGLVVVNLPGVFVTLFATTFAPDPRDHFACRYIVSALGRIRTCVCCLLRIRFWSDRPPAVRSHSPPAQN